MLSGQCFVQQNVDKSGQQDGFEIGDEASERGAMTRVLITGIAGFVGTHLAHYLLSKGNQLFGFDLAASSLSPALAQRVRLYSGDICDQTALKQVLTEAQPDIVYHLAGVLKSTDAKKFYTVHVLGTVALFEAIIGLGITPKVLVASSSAVYGRGFGGKPITEQFKLRPITHYAVSKVAQETVAYRYWLAHQLPVVCTRTFNLIGPGQPPELACSAFARQIALAEHTEKADTVITGNLSAQRDFTDVRDAVRAYDLITTFGKPGLTYNVCSGGTVSIRQCLDMLLEMVHVSLKTTVDPGRLQPHDVPIQVGNAARLYDHTGWKPEITLQQSLADLLHYWRQEVRSQISG